MRDISSARIERAISETQKQVNNLDQDDEYLTRKEKIISIAIKELGITDKEPIYQVVRSEFERVIK
ncbi:MAG: hypothetical protein WBK67_02660 [Minisyncoccales bacterium]